MYDTERSTRHDRPMAAQTDPQRPSEARDAAAQPPVLRFTTAGADVAETLHAAPLAVTGEVPIKGLWPMFHAFPAIGEIWLQPFAALGHPSAPSDRTPTDRTGPGRPAASPPDATERSVARMVR